MISGDELLHFVVPLEIVSRMLIDDKECKQRLPYKVMFDFCCYVPNKALIVLLSR